MPASSPSVQSGWLVLRPPGSKSSSTKRFFLLLPDFVLYSFRTEVDPCALTATPVPGFTVLTGAQLKGDSGCSEKDRDKVIKMYHPPSKRTYFFAGTSAKSGTDIRVFETREASISGVNVPVARVQRVDEEISVPTVTTDVITAEPDVVEPSTFTTAPAPTVDPTPTSTPTTTPTSDPTPSPAPDPTPYTPPDTGGGGGYGY